MGQLPDSSAAVVAGVSPADIKELQPARLPLQGEAVVASYSLRPKTASPAKAKICRHIQLDGSDLKREIDQRMQRHSHKRNKDERLEQASPWCPVSRRVLLITANPDRYSSEKQQRPQSAAEPSPFQSGLQIIFVQESPSAGNALDRYTVIRRKYNAKRCWPESEKANVGERSNGDARS